MQNLKKNMWEQHLTTNTHKLAKRDWMLFAVLLRKKNYAIDLFRSLGLSWA